MAASSIIAWLLDPDYPFIHCRTLLGLEGAPAHSRDMRAARRRVRESPEVQQLLVSRAADNLWYPHDRKGAVVKRDPIHHYNIDATLLSLQLLAEWGLDCRDNEVNASATSLMEVLERQWDFSPSCRTDFILHVLSSLGLSDHHTVVRLAESVRGGVRWDHGQLCPRNVAKRKVKPTKSCVRATTKALLAFASHPQLRKSVEARGLALYYLRRRVFFRTTQPDAVVRQEMMETSFPFFSGTAGLLEIVYGLSVLGFGEHPETAPMWQAVEQKTDSSGKVTLDRYWLGPSHNHVVPEAHRTHGDKWATLYVELARQAVKTANAGRTG